MKPLTLDQKAKDYLLLTQAAELLRDDRWVPFQSKFKGNMCILQALHAAEHGVDDLHMDTDPPAELILLCKTRLDDQRKFPTRMAGLAGRDEVWLFNDHVCESAEEAVTIVEQAADLVLLRT